MEKTIKFPRPVQMEKSSFSYISVAFGQTEILLEFLQLKTE
jgi:hypothetical protein